MLPAVRWEMRGKMNELRWEHKSSPISYRIKTTSLTRAALSLTLWATNILTCTSLTIHSSTCTDNYSCWLQWSLTDWSKIISLLKQTNTRVYYKSVPLTVCSTRNTKLIPAFGGDSLCYKNSCNLIEWCKCLGPVYGMCKTYINIFLECRPGCS